MRTRLILNPLIVAFFLSFRTFRIQLQCNGSFLPGCVVHRACACMCSLIHVCASYMNKEEEFGAVGKASKRKANGQNLGFTLVSLI